MGRELCEENNKLSIKECERNRLPSMGTARAPPFAGQGLRVTGLARVEGLGLRARVDASPRALQLPRGAFPTSVFTHIGTPRECGREDNIIPRSNPS